MYVPGVCAGKETVRQHGPLPDQPDYESSSAAISAVTHLVGPEPPGTDPGTPAVPPCAAADAPVMETGDGVPPIVGGGKQ